MSTRALPIDARSPPAAIARQPAGWTAAIGLTVAILALHLLGLRPGHDWSDDYAMYLAHAINLLSDRPYADTGFIPNPWAVPGPATYPPVYPFAIVPLVAAWGPDLQVLKAFGVLMLGAFLLVAYALWHPRIGARPALILLAVLGLSPYFIGFRDEVRPDTMFAFLFLASLLLGERWTGQPQPWSLQTLRRGLLLGLLVYLAYGTRSLGIVLLPAFGLVELVRLRRLSPTLLSAGAVFSLLVVAQSVALHSDSGYAGNLTLDPATLRFNTQHYATSLSVLWTNAWPAPWGTASRAALFGISLLLAAIGYVLALRRGVTALEVVGPLYFVPLVVYWVGTMIQQRYVLPLLPLLLLYAWMGLQKLMQARQPAGRSVAKWAVGLPLAVLVAGATVTSHVSSLRTAARAEIQPGVTDADTREVFDWIRTHTAPDAVLLVGRARAFALYTQRRGVSPFGYRDADAIWRLIQDHAVTHVVVGLGPLAREMDYEHPAELAASVSALGPRLQRVLRNGSFEIHQVVRP